MTVLYQVSISWVKSEYVPGKVEAVIGAIGSWARLNSSTWFVWSDATSINVYNKLAQCIVQGDSITVFPVVSEHRSGWAPGWFWTWVDSKGTTDINGKPI